MARIVRSLALGGAVMGMACIASGQTRPTTQALAATTQEVPERRPFALTLVVLDKETREPISDVKVRWIARDADGNFGGRGVTDATGVYEFDLPTNKLPHLGSAIRMTGYIPMAARWSGTVPGEFTLEMERGQTIGGTVVDDAGQPVVGAKVTLNVRRDAGQPNAGFDIAGDWVKTGANGVWAYDRVPAGFTSASVNAADPRYVAGEGASIANAKPDDALARRLTLALHRGQAIDGAVTDAAGHPIEGAAIRVADVGSAEAVERVKTVRDGKFQLAVDAARRPRLLVVKEGFAPGVIDLAAANDAAAGPIKLTLQPGKTLRLKITDPTGRPIAGAWTIIGDWQGLLMGETIQSDANGDVIWRSAPADGFEAYFSARGFKSQNAVRLRATDDVQGVTLSPEIGDGAKAGE